MYAFVGAFESESTGGYCACAGARARTSPFQPSFLAHSLIYGPLLPNLLITRRVKSDRQNKLQFLGNVVFLSEIWIIVLQLCRVQWAWEVFVSTAWKVVDILNARNCVKEKITQHILKNGCKGLWWISKNLLSISIKSLSWTRILNSTIVIEQYKVR